MDPMTPREIAYYKAKYRFQWWWYDGGGSKTVEDIFGATTLFVGVYVAWWLAYLLEP
jgi:hypothetical protein